MGNKSIWQKLTLVAVATAVIVTVAAPLYASSGAAGGPTIWGIPEAKWWDFLWRVLNFTALAVILAKFVVKPIANGMKNRQTGIKEQFDDLESQKAEAERAYREFEGKLSGIDQEIKDLLDKAKAQGEVEKERIIEEANRAAEDIKRQAEMAIQHELAEAKLHLREDVANQAVVMAEELIKKNLKADDQVKLVEDYLEKVGAIQ